MSNSDMPARPFTFLLKSHNLFYQFRPVQFIIEGWTGEQRITPRRLKFWQYSRFSNITDSPFGWRCLKFRWIWPPPMLHGCVLCNGCHGVSSRKYWLGIYTHLSTCSIRPVYFGWFPDIDIPQSERFHSGLVFISMDRDSCWQWVNSIFSRGTKTDLRSLCGAKERCLPGTNGSEPKWTSPRKTTLGRSFIEPRCLLVTNC